jgi:beta-glucosidase
MKWFGRLCALVALAAPAPAAAQPWMDPALAPDARASMVLRAMRQDEKLRLVLGYFGNDGPNGHDRRPADSRPASAGYVAGVPRLNIPPQWETDAGIGVATSGHAGVIRERTALPSGLATAATWNPDLAFAAGAMIGAEARDSGFNVMLAGGVNLARDPRNGRNFEYAGEDPLLAGTMAGAGIAGIQSNHIISTVKHFALNDQETGRDVLSARIGEAAARESDLLAFELAIERGDPGAVMCAYNRVNAVYACENDFLLTRVLKQDWHFPGYVMSDWGAVHSVQAANAGLDQESAAQAFDKIPYFGKELENQLASGKVPQSRLDDMARRILRALFAKGVVDNPVHEAAIDRAAHAHITEADSVDSLVLLKNAREILPLPKNLRRIAVIGSHADKGVLSGGGSSQVYPAGGMAVPGLGPPSFPGPEIYDPSSPLLAIKTRLPHAEIRFDSGEKPDSAASVAAGSDVAIVFAHQWTAESQDASLTLPDGQDALIAKVAAANKRIIVILETGGPVLMPWLDRVQGVLEAWYPGTRGGDAIARVLFGETDASGRLPITFPRNTAQLPRPTLDGDPAHQDIPFTVTYSEGAAVGYKWFDRTHQDPLFPFGFGLSFGQASYAHLHSVAHGNAVTVSFDVRNDSSRAIRDVPQIYVESFSAGWDAPRRLAGWSKLDLAPGMTRHVSLSIDPRILARWDVARSAWIIAAGTYSVLLGSSSRSVSERAGVTLPEMRLQRP